MCVCVCVCMYVCVCVCLGGVSGSESVMFFISRLLNIQYMYI